MQPPEDLFSPGKWQGQFELVFDVVRCALIWRPGAKISGPLSPDWVIVGHMQNQTKTLTMTKSIEPARIVSDYQKSKSRLILLDYDGTLVPSDFRYDHAKPDSRIKELLGQLASDPKNDIILISGRDKEHLDAQWQNVPITLVAEHGGYYRNPSEAWQNVFSFRTDWVPKILSALNALSFQYEGTFVELKNYSVAWHYGAIKDKITADDKRQILAAIRSLPERKYFDIYDGEFTIELRTIGVDKGSFISHWASHKSYDFIMALGDGLTDEDMFKILGKDAYSIKIGRSNNSSANYHLKDQTEVAPFLQMIIYAEIVTAGKSGLG